jgi:hypothetical protein
MMYIRSSATYLSNALAEAMDRLPELLGANVATMWLPSPVATISATATAAATVAANAADVFQQMINAQVWSGAATYGLSIVTCALVIMAIVV